MLMASDGLVDKILHPEIYEAGRRALRSLFVVVEGKLQRQGRRVSVLSSKVIPLQVGE